jgi:hypothetical protein
VIEDRRIPFLGRASFINRRLAVHHELIVGYVYGLEDHSVDLQTFPPWRRFL